MPGYEGWLWTEKEWSAPGAGHKERGYPDQRLYGPQVWPEGCGPCSRRGFVGNPYVWPSSRFPSEGPIQYLTCLACSEDFTYTVMAGAVWAVRGAVRLPDGSGYCL